MWLLIKLLKINRKTTSFNHYCLLDIILGHLSSSGIVLMGNDTHSKLFICSCFFLKTWLKNYIAECIILIFYSEDICHKFQSHEKGIRVVKNWYELLSNPVLKDYDMLHSLLFFPFKNPVKELQTKFCQ